MKNIYVISEKGSDNLVYILWLKHYKKREKQQQQYMGNRPRGNKTIC